MFIYLLVLCYVCGVLISCLEIDLCKLSFLYVRRRVLSYPNDLCYFLRLTWNFFLAFSDLRNNEVTNNLYVCHSVILLPFHLSSFLYLNIFQSAPNLVHVFLNAIHQDAFFFSNFWFLLFLLTFSIFWDLANFWGEIQTTSKSNSYGFYEVNGPF